MTDDKYKDMVISHDKDIETLAGSIEHLALNVGETNHKLDNVIDVITQQNVLVERINNLDTNVAESFKRAWKRLEILETTAATGGCSIAKTATATNDLLDEKLKVVSKSISDNTDDVKVLNTKVENTVPSTVVRWVMGLLVFYSVAFGTYIVSSIHETDTIVSAYIAKDTQNSAQVKDKLSDIIYIMRNDGRVITRPAGPRVAPDLNFDIKD